MRPVDDGLEAAAVQDQVAQDQIAVHEPLVDGLVDHVECLGSEPTHGTDVEKARRIPLRRIEPTFEAREQWAQWTASGSR